LKKFKFSLQSLSDYKEHLFENEKNLLSQMQMTLATQESAYAQKLQEILDCQQDIARKMNEGITVGELTALQGYLKSLEKQLEELAKQIEITKNRIAQQTKVVLALKTEQAALDKLREKQLVFYNKSVEKEQEKLIDEFVTTKSHMQAV